MLRGTMSSSHRRDPSKLGLLFLGLLISSLHTLYWLSFGWPVVTVGGGLVTAAGAVTYPAKRGAIALWMAGALVVTVVFLSATWGASDFGRVAVKGFVGPLYGAALFCLIASRTEIAADLQRCCTGLLFIHVGFWLVQFVLVHSTDVYLDFTGYLSDNASRHETFLYTSGFAGAVLRCTGLFAEPSEYGEFIFMLVSVRLLGSSFHLRWLDWIGMVTMIGTFSLTGMSLAGLLILISAAAQWRGVRGWSVLFIGSSVPCVLWGMTDLFVYAFERTQRLDRDSSTNMRFGSLLDYVDRCDEWHLLLGRGLGAYSDVTGVGSGLAWLVVYLGILGSIAFIFALGFALWSNRVPAYAYVMLAATLIPAPMLTAAIWWIWIACLVLIGATTIERGKQPLISSRLPACSYR